LDLNKIVAVLLVILFVFFSLAVIMTWSVGDGVLNADAYVEALSDADAFQVPYQLIREGRIPGVGGLLLREGPLSIVSGADLELVARELAPPTWLRAQLEGALRGIFAVVKEPEGDELPGMVISLSEVKARALGEPGDRALTVVIENLQVCAPGEPSLDLSRDVPLCKPAGMDLNPFLGQLKGLLVPLVNRVPDTYTVSWQPEQQGVIRDLQRAAQTVERLRFVMLLLVALNLALLGLIWVLAVRSPAEWLRWTGVPLLVLGLATLTLALLISSLVSLGLDGNASWVEESLPRPLAESLEMAVREYILLLFRPARTVGVVLFLVGAVMALVSPLFPGARQKNIRGYLEAREGGQYSRSP
jgi:hypothetical protein